MSATVCLALTMGDPAGIGPEIVVKALAALRRRPRAPRVVVFGDRAALERAARIVRVRFHTLFDQTYSAKEFRAAGRGARFSLVDFQNAAGVRLGKVSRRAGEAAGEYIRAAVEAVTSGRCDALVTAPINKAAFGKGRWGRRFVGHTEMLTALTGSKETALLLVSGPLRAIHVTSHIPLRDVSRSLTAGRVALTIRLAKKGMASFGMRNPRIAVCGLNPHAGDGGLLGDEENRVIAPAVRRCRSAGVRVEGPLPPDTVWPLVAAGRFDIGVAMYHDQGQIAVKLAAFRRAKGGGVLPGGVNVTVGLPIVRTSPAHGTAYDIAGRGLASESSLLEAIDMALLLHRKGAR